MPRPSEVLMGRDAFAAVADRLRGLTPPPASPLPQFSGRAS